MELSTTYQFMQTKAAKERGARETDPKDNQEQEEELKALKLKERQIGRASCRERV